MMAATGVATDYCFAVTTTPCMTLGGGALIQSIQKERPLTADEVREIGCYNGARGIWRDKASTAHLSEAGNGVCVGISSRGKYEDKIGEQTGTYYYPSTQATTQDLGDTDAMRSALSLDMPLFLIRDTNATGELQGQGTKATGGSSGVRC